MIFEAQSNCENTIVLNQVPFSLINRRFQDNGFIDYAMANDIMVCCWWPLESGRLTDRGIGILDRMCDKYDRTPSQIALNWLISQKSIAAISVTRDMEHLEESLGSLGWQLDEEDIRLLDRDFPIKENSSIAEDSWSRVLSD
jgi:diketogulonate reductase-like aldo/keto reductase